MKNNSLSLLSLKAFSKKDLTLSSSSMKSFSKDTSPLSVTTAGLKRKREAGLVRKLKKIDFELDSVGEIRKDLGVSPLSRRKKLVETQLQQVRDSSKLQDETIISVTMSTKMCNSETLLLKDKEDSKEKRKRTLWPSWAQVSGSGRLKRVSFPLEMQEEITDFIEGYGCSWQEE